MPEGQDKHGILICNEAIKCDVTGIAEWNEQFTFRRIVQVRTSDFGMRFEKCELPFDGFRGAPCSKEILVGQEPTASFEAGGSAGCHD